MHDHKRMPLHDEAPEDTYPLEAFRKEFGRDPCPGDQIFLDPGADKPVPLNPQQ
jgi:hypothetical protein